MKRSIDYFTLVDKYLRGELGFDEKARFEAELLINDELAEELRLHQEVALAATEKMVLELRKSLREIEKDFVDESEKNQWNGEEYSFGLSEEIDRMEEFDVPIDDLQIDSFANSLHKLHLNQHKKAAKEKVHEIYKNEGNEDGSQKLSTDDVILNNVKGAICEKDIMNLRMLLQNIGQSMPKHQRSIEEIELYLENGLSVDMMKDFEAELKFNYGLQEDVKLIKDIDAAIEEKDVMNLRASLEYIGQKENATTRSTEEIEAFATGEMDEDLRASFEEELKQNPGLVTEVNLYTDINEAIAEKDIMSLRNELANIRAAKGAVKETKRVVFDFTKNSKKVWMSAVASIAVILVFTALLGKHGVSDADMYNSFYSRYESGGVYRSGGTEADESLTDALQKYNEKDYVGAIELFEQLVVNGEDNASSNFYAGVSYQELGNYPKAIGAFEKVLAEEDNLFIEQAEWYVGLCYLKTKQKAKAIEKFEKIRNSQSFYRIKADKLYKRIAND
jgi:tetratricopeptide (TPR) repeat protein